MSTAKPVFTNPFVLYQSALLSTYAERLIHGFTGKPVTLGGQPLELALAGREQVCAHLGLNQARLTLPKQTHTDRFRTNDTPCDDNTDAVILTEPDIPAMAQTADCVPIILYEPERHIGAVIHSGWRGTAQVIVPKVLQQLVKEHGAQVERVCAVIGPSIGGCCYEVSPDVAAAVAGTIVEVGAEKFSVLQKNGKPRVDLQQVIRYQLQHLGVANVEIIAACTRCDDEHLWSHRRGEAGRQVAFLQLL